MRIAVVNDTVYPFSKGGAQKRVYEISRRLVKRGHEVNWYGMECGTKEIEGIRMHAVSPAYKMYTREGRRIVSQALKFAVKLRIREKVEIIDCMNFPYLHCFPTKAYAMRQKTPMVITWFEFWGKYWHEYSGKLAPIGMMVERAAATLPNMIITDSEKVKGQLVGVGVKDSKVIVIPDGVDIKAIAEAEPSKERYDVVYVGRILKHKNVGKLIEAMVGVKGATLAIVGDGECRAECEGLVTDLEMGDRVKFFGRISDDKEVYAIMKSAKVLVLPSVQEGHPLVIPEANACGIPVIGIRGVCDEFIENGQTGYLTELHEFPMRQLIEKAISLYPRFREPCLTESKKYDWEIVTDKVEAVYKELVSKGTE